MFAVDTVWLGRSAGKRSAPWLVIAAVHCLLGSGCAAVSNPVALGIPVRYLPQEYLASPKEELKQIPLTFLRQQPPDNHAVDAGDVLGIYVEGILGEKGQPPPVRLPDQQNPNPAVGYPVIVSEDGTIPLPLIPPLKVKTFTMSQVREAIRKEYVDRKLLQPGKEQILVSLLRPRHVRVQVVRQDAGTVSLGAGVIVGSTRRGTGAIVELPAYENDVLNALTRTGGLPGFDAINEIVVERGDPFKGGEDPSRQVLRIPLRIREGAPIPFQRDDVILKNGDVVFIEARESDVYYTGGLLQPRQYILPRDIDLRVVDAISLGGGPLVNSITTNNLSGNITATGIGSPSPSRVTVLRRTRDYGQVAIKIDLNCALNDPRENILVQAGDVIILQETVGEAATRYFSGAFRYNFFDIVGISSRFLGTVTLQGP